MNRILATLAMILSLAISAGGSNAQPKSTKQPFHVVAYLPDYRIETIDPAACAGVTDVIFFSIEPTAGGELNTARLNAQAIKKLQEIKKLHKNRLLIAVGGWDRSKEFAPLAQNPAARARFIKNLQRFCLENQVDGVDLDWEHPANQKEEDAYAALLAELRQAFGQRLLVTVALAHWQNPGAKAYQAVDRVHLMSYDYEGPRHATFERSVADVKVLVDRGVPRSKICLGLPFYGRGMKDRNLLLTYAEIVKKHHPGPEADEAGGVYFNGIHTIQRKTRYAKDNHLGGVMIWELGQDSGTTLLRAVQKAVGSRQ